MEMRPEMEGNPTSPEEDLTPNKTKRSKKVTII